MDLFLEVGTVKGRIQHVLGLLQPFLRHVVLVEIRIGKAQAEPGCRHIGQHPMKRRTQQLGRVDRSAVKDQLRAFRTRRL